MRQTLPSGMEEAQVGARPNSGCCAVSMRSEPTRSEAIRRAPGLGFRHLLLLQRRLGALASEGRGESTMGCSGRVSVSRAKESSHLCRCAWIEGYLGQSMQDIEITYCVP